MTRYYQVVHVHVARSAHQAHPHHESKLEPERHEIHILEAQHRDHSPPPEID